MCCHSVIERQQLEHRAGAEDCVNVHDAPSHGEVCVFTDFHRGIAEYVIICPKRFSLSGRLLTFSAFFHETLKIIMIFYPFCCSLVLIISEDLFTNYLLWVASPVQAY